MTAERAAGAAQGTRTQLSASAPVSLRCNAPQRTPRWPDTPWGRLRGQTGWSLRDLSERTGVNPGLLSRIERGFGPTPDQARRLLAAFDEAGAR